MHSQHCQSRLLSQAKHQVHVLHRGSSRALDQVVERREDHHPTAFVVYIYTDLAEVRAGQRGDTWVGQILPGHLGVFVHIEDLDEVVTLVKIFEQVEHLAAVEGFSNEAMTGCEDAASEGRVEGREMDLDLLASERGQLLLHLIR